MDGTAVKELKELTLEGVVEVIGGQAYSPRTMTPVYHDPRPEPLRIQSLTGVAEYLKTNVDLYKMSGLLIHVVDHEEVRVITNVHGESNERHSVLVAEYDDGVAFPFGEWVNQESFIIKARSRFENTDDLNLILHHTAKIDTESAVVTQDDGVAQKIQVKKGVSGALTESKELKPIVTLKPHRTFAEIDQPESEFLFRMKNNDGRVYCALFESDNSAWKNTARRRIASYLSGEGVAVIA